ncbi:MAG: ABC transporter permease [Bacteroidales bacterium]|nr:ABC transporter permease [Bacteroidales bacterium]
MIWKTSWKNVWRNKTRSLVVVISIVIGVAGGLFYIAFSNGMVEQRLYDALNNEVAHIQLTNNSFRANNEIHYNIPQSRQLIQELQADPEITGVSERLIINGMATVSGKNSGIQLLGVDPEMEKEVTDIYKFVVPETGSWDNLKKENQIIIGEAMAKELNLVNYRPNAQTIDSLAFHEVHQSVVEKIKSFDGMYFRNEKKYKRELERLLGTQDYTEYSDYILEYSRVYRMRAKVIMSFVDVDSNQVTVAYRIGGIYKFSNKLYENMTAYVNGDHLRELANMQEGSSHQIMIRVSELDNCMGIRDRLKDQYPDFEVLSWKEIQTDLAYMEEMMAFFYSIFMLIILGALSFGIINTMLMAVLERTKELGMLTAIGMNRRKVFGMIMLESVFLSLSGGVIGMILGEILIVYTHHTGISLAGMSEAMESMGYSSILYPSIPNSFFITLTILVIITGVLSAIYPAIKALKMNPSEALRTD